MASLAVRPSLSAKSVVALAFLCIAIGHLAMRTYVPSAAVNAAAIGAVTAILSWVLLAKKDVFSFLLILFTCSQFRIASNQGGLFNLVAFILLSIYFARHRIRETPAVSDPAIYGALVILFLANTIGLVIRNPMPLLVKGLEFAAFTGILLAFYAAAQLRLTEQRLRSLAFVLAFIVLWNLFVSLNQFYSVFLLKTPFLGIYDDTFVGTTNSFGTFGSASANGQFAMMVLVFLLPLICSTDARAKLRLRPLYFIGVATASGLVIVLANMRAAALEAAMAIILYIAMFSILYRRSFRYSKYLTRFAITLLVILVFFGAWVGLQELSSDFQTVEITATDDLFSGESLNRLGPWQFGWNILANESWLVGYGHGVAQSNLQAWGGRPIGGGLIVGGGHFHNLYLALPTLYGWFGSAAYVFLFVVIALRLYRTVRRFSLDRLTVVVALGFLVSCGLFLVDEIKSGNAVQYINYPMLVFIWFGLALGAVRTAKEDVFMAGQSRRTSAAQAPPHNVEVVPGR